MAISLSQQWYIFINTRLLVHVEGVLTQLVFEHSLRIRMKAEPSDSTDKLSAAPGGGRPKANNLIGKINNLVTTDMASISDARDPLMLGETYQLLARA